ncbi:DUF433 domain-containing protein [Marivirga tractuosa]|uniref:DUF433 domain-containing protein n=1 Tax=Marivirga tractuosa TaxID=1006 RepID=UPI0035D03987
MEDLNQHIEINPAIQNGPHVFSGTRVPVKTLFWHLKKGISIDEFLLDYPSVKKIQIKGVLNLVQKIFSSNKFESNNLGKAENFINEWPGFLSVEDVEKQSLII